MRLRLFCLLAALGAATGAGAQNAPVYRSVLPDGSIVYGDKAVPGARDAREVELPPPNIALPEPVQAPASASDPKKMSRGAALDAAQAEVLAASDALDRAKAALNAGQEPLPGETQGTAIPGRRRHTEAYTQRIKALEDAVTRAQARLDAALDRRNALR